MDEQHSSRTCCESAKVAHWSSCFALLCRKAELYERLARGEAEDADERYEVDFLLKGVDPRSREVDTAELAVHTATGGVLGVCDIADGAHAVRFAGTLRRHALGPYNIH